MHNQPSIAPLKPNLNTGSQPPGKKLVLHYIIDNKVVCEAEFRLPADALFLALPIPVRHRLMMGAAK